MRNVGGIDKVIRVIVGLGLVSLVFMGPKTAWGWVGVVPLLSGLFSSCSLYSIIGFNSCKNCKD